MATVHETEHSGGHHPSLRQYIFIAVLLFVITIVEFILILDSVGIREAAPVATTVLLFLLSAIKFAIVILFYMHLKFDNKLFFWVFLAGMVLALMVGLSLIGLFTAVKPTLGGEPRLPDVAAPCHFSHEAMENECPDPTPQPTSTPAPTLEALAITAPAVAIGGGPDPGGEPTAEKGRQLADSYGCVACHSTDGTVLVGPSWQGIFGSQESLEGGGTATVDGDYIRESINDPYGKLVEGFGELMPTGLGVTDEEIDSIILYIESLQ